MNRRLQGMYGVALMGMLSLPAIVSAEPGFNAEQDQRFPTYLTLTLATQVPTPPQPGIDDEPHDFWPEFALGIGYAKFKLPGSAEPLDSLDCIRFDPRGSFSPIPGLPQLRLGFGVGMTFGGSGLDNGAIIINDGQLIIIGSGRDQALSLFEPEFELSWRFGTNRTFFVEPGAAVGGAFGYYRIAESYTSSESEFSEWSSTAFARGFIRAGFMVEGGYAGLEASYLKGGEMGFSDTIRGDLEEFYIGFFGVLAF